MISLPLETTKEFSQTFDRTRFPQRLQPQNPEGLEILGTGCHKIVLGEGDYAVCVEKNVSHFEAYTSKALANMIHEFARIGLFPCYAPETFSCHPGQKSILGFPGFVREKIDIDHDRPMTDDVAAGIYAEVREFLGHLNPENPSSPASLIGLDIESNNGNLVYDKSGRVVYTDLPYLLYGFPVELDLISLESYLHAQNCPQGSLSYILHYASILLEVQDLYHVLAKDIYECDQLEIESILAEKEIPLHYRPVVWEGVENIRRLEELIK